jgi:hypothetical protein
MMHMATAMADCGKARGTMAHELKTGHAPGVRRSLPICDLWLAVDEEQTLHLGMRRAWHWLEGNQPARAERRCGRSSSEHEKIQRTPA